MQHLLKRHGALGNKEADHREYGQKVIPIAVKLHAQELQVKEQKKRRETIACSQISKDEPKQKALFIMANVTKFKDVSLNRDGAECDNYFLSLCKDTFDCQAILVNKGDGHITKRDIMDYLIKARDSLMNSGFQVLVLILSSHGGTHTTKGEFMIVGTVLCLFDYLLNAQYTPYFRTLNMSPSTLRVKS